MPDANYLIENPEKGIDPITAYTASAANYESNELAKFRITDTDIEKLVVKVLGQATGKGKKAPKAERINLRANCLEAEFEDSIDKTPTFTMTIHDPDWSLLNTGTLEKPMDLNPGGLKGLWYRLDSFDVDDDRITLTFVTRNAVYLALHKRPVKASRGKVTRAEFILMLLHKVKVVKIRMYCPQLHKSQTTAKLTQSARTSRQRGDERAKGFTPSDKITVKNAPANPEQRNNIEEVIQAGIDKKAPSSLIVIALMVVAQESSALNSATNGQFVGCFQQSPAYGWVASRNAYKDAHGTPGKRGFFDAAIPVYKKMVGQDFGVIGREIQMPNGSWKASAVNRSYANDVNRWRDEAEHSVNSFSGVDDGGDPSDPVGSTTYRAKYEFSVGPPENDKHETYLAGIYRLADEVNWRAYWVRDVLHYMSEEDLFKAKARARLRRYENGVEKVRFGWDKQKKINTMTLSVRMERWICPVGTVVIFDEGGPARGRWLVTNVRRSMFDTLGEITLRKPMVEKREPIKTATRSPTDDSGTGTGGSAPTGTPGSPADPGEIEGTPKHIIDTVVIPLALQIYPKFLAGGGTGLLTPEHVATANAGHGPTNRGTRSDHQGPAGYAWAADISYNWTNFPNGEKHMDELAKQVQALFRLPNWYGGCFPANSSNGRYRFQICYRTLDGGNHYDHVHVGVQDLRANPNGGN